MVSQKFESGLSGMEHRAQKEGVLNSGLENF